MARDLVLDVITKAEAEGLRRTSAELDKTAGSVEKLDREARHMSDGLLIIPGRAQQMGEEFEKSARQSDVLKKALGEARAELAKLENQLGDSGDTSLLKGITKQRTLVNSLQREVSRLDQELANSAAAATATGSRFETAASQGGVLQKAIAAARAELKRLEEQLVQTGNVGLLKNIGSQRSLIGGLEQAFKDLTPGIPKVTNNLFNQISSSFADMPWGGMLIGALVPAAIAAAPAIASALGGVLSAGIGGGAIALGIMAAKDDPGVKSAWSMFASSAAAQFKSAGSAFAQPLEQAARIATAAFTQMDLFRILRDAAPLVERFSQGLAGLAVNFSHGFADALEHSMPALNELAGLLPTIGSALGEAIDMIARSPNSAEGIRTFVNIIDAGVLMLGQTIRWLEDRWDELLSLIAGAATFLADKFGWIPGVGDKLRQLQTGAIYLQTGVMQADSALASLQTTAEPLPGSLAAWAKGFDDAAVAADVNAKAIAGMNQAMDEAIQKVLGGKQASLAWKTDLVNLKEEFRKGTFSLSDFTTAGTQHQQMMQAAIGDAERWREQLIAQGTPADIANEKYNDMIKSLEAMAIKAGADAKAVHALYDQLLILPENTNLFINVHTTGADILNSGESHAGNTSHAKTSNKPAKPSHQLAPARAAGGPVWPGQLFQVNENGPEYFLPSARGNVSPRPSGGGGRIVFDMCSGGDAVARAFAEWLRAAVRGEGGVDVFFEERR